MPNFRWMEISMEIEDKWKIEVEDSEGILVDFDTPIERDTTYLLDGYAPKSVINFENSEFHFGVKKDAEQTGKYQLEDNRKLTVRFFIQKGWIITVKNEQNEIVYIDPKKIKLARLRSKVWERHDWCTLICGYRICTG